MMVDVISLQHAPFDVQANQTYNSTFMLNKTTGTHLLQNRQCYPFQGMRDDASNFYAGNAYNVHGNLANTNKRPLSSTETSIHKKQKKEDICLKTSHTFTSKPYDVMDNLMCYY